MKFVKSSLLKSIPWFRDGNAPTVRTAGAAKTDMQLTVSSLLLNDLRQF
jgi:hypothetical protein